MQIFELCPPVAAAPWPVAYAPLVSALATAAVGYFAVVVAKGQLDTAMGKLRFDLYERRLAVFQVCAEDIEASNMHDDGFWPRHHALYQAKLSAVFMFDDDVVQYVDGLYARISSGRNDYFRRRQGKPPGAVFQEELEWQRDERKGAIEAFKPYLLFVDRRTTPKVGWGKSKTK